MPLRDRGLENALTANQAECALKTAKSRQHCALHVLLSRPHMCGESSNSMLHDTQQPSRARRPCRGPLADPPTDRAARCHPLFYKELFQRRSVGRTQTDCDCSVGHNGIGRTGRPSQLTSITTFPTCCPPRTANHRDRHNQPACRPNSLPRVVANRQRLWRSFPDGKRRGRPRRN